MTRDTPTHCRNCGAELAGEYCHVCGQRGAEPRRPVIGLVEDVLVDTLAIEGRLARTFGLLLVSPARLARSYIEGKRVRYTPPFRLFLFTSVLFFLMVFALIPSRPGPIVVGDETVVRAEVTVDQDEEPQAADESDAETAEDPESAEPPLSWPSERWEDVNYDGPEWLEPHVQRMYIAVQNLLRDPRLFLAQTRTLLPRFLLLAPVLYALILSLLYIYRRKFLAYDHFVVSLYMHAGLYALLTLSTVISRAPAIGDFSFLPILWGVIQPFRMLGRVYGSNIVSVVLKGVISQALYWTGVLMILGAGLSYTLYQS